ncbi:MAG: hypothetical protein ACLQVK_10535 [Acidimicrobiales bacterium]|jgi:hypothetical protein
MLPWGWAERHVRQHAAEAGAIAEHHRLVREAVADAARRPVRSSLRGRLAWALIGIGTRLLCRGGAPGRATPP